MRLSHGRHLAYCTNIHRGETWSQTLENLERYTMQVREQVAGSGAYAIGLRLSAAAARELAEPSALKQFRHWLDRRECYLFTINGFPYGQFHGARVKEQVYAPDWTTPERVAYTNLLFDLLGELVPPGVEGSVSTVPGSFKEFITSPEQEAAMRRRIWESVEHAARVSDRCGRHLHLGLEPEPLCFLETSSETVDFLHRIREEHPGDPRFERHLGVNYDACHLAVEFEEPGEVVRRFQEQEIRISKIHLSSALKVRPSAASFAELARFREDIYLHQVVARFPGGRLERRRDLDEALADPCLAAAEEWRIHFHVPLHCAAAGALATTSDHLLGLIDQIGKAPALCSHFEMETYTWEVLPAEIKNRNVVDQLVAEYRWTLGQLALRGVVSEAAG